MAARRSPLIAASLLAADLPQFRDTTITTSLKMGYQSVVADLNRDGIRIRPWSIASMAW
jgi:hypothetical protein